MEILTDIVITASFYFLLFGIVIALLIGILLLCAPQVLQRINAAGNRWVSSRKMGHSLDTQIDSNQFILSHPRVFGVLLIAVSAFVLVEGGTFFVTTSAAEGAQLIADLIPLPFSNQLLWEVIWVSSGTVFLLGSITSAILGVLMLTRMDLLIRLNVAASREYSVRKLSKSLDVERQGVDEKLLKYPRIWGAVVTVNALYVLLKLLPHVTSFQ